jgi:hypothetical protein
MGPPTAISASPALPATGVYRYDAFISYRHVEPDRRWAKWLHSALETYRVPRKLVQKGIARRVGRVFRDEEEFAASADLHQNVESTLRESRQSARPIRVASSATQVRLSRAWKAARQDRASSENATPLPAISL